MEDGVAVSDGLQATWQLVLPKAQNGAVTVICVVSHFVGSFFDVAVTFAVPVVPGAVYWPVAGLILPKFVDHSTPDPAPFPVPFTVAVHTEIPPVLTDDGLQLAVTDVTVLMTPAGVTVNVTVREPDG